MIYNGYILKPHPISPSLTIIAVEGQGGSIPTVLASAFTTNRAAIEAIDEYVKSRDGAKTGATRGKTNSKN